MRKSGAEKWKKVIFFEDYNSSIQYISIFDRGLKC